MHRSPWGMKLEQAFQVVGGQVGIGAEGIRQTWRWQRERVQGVKNAIVGRVGLWKLSAVETPWHL